MTSRRNFFKMAGLAGVAAATPLASVAAAQVAEKETGARVLAGGVKLSAPLSGAPDLSLTESLNLGKCVLNDGVVMNASHWGIVKAHVKGGKIERLEPVAEDKAPSLQLQAVAQQPYNTARIRYPMVRKSYLEKGIKAGGKGRGSDEYVRVTWDKALELVAGELKRVAKEYGPTSVFGGSYGWMSPGAVGNARNLMQRILNLNGGFTDNYGDYSTGCAQIILPYVIGSNGVYEQMTSWKNINRRTELVVLWGCDPTVTNDIDWATTLHEDAEGFRMIKEKGIPVVAVNPLKPDLAEYYGEQCEWIAPRPNTDVAMMLGMAYELEANGLADKTFLDKYTVGYEKFKPYLLGKTDGTPKTPEWAAKICGVPAENIKRLARTMREKRAMLMGGWGIQRAQYGEQVHWMMVVLSAMCGHIGTAGGGFGFSFHYSNGGAATSDAPVLPGMSSKPRGCGDVKKVHIPLARITECILNPGKTIDFNGKKVTYPKIKMVMWSGGNPMAQQEDTNGLVKAWQTLDTIVVTDSMWTASARHADIVLPACTSLERNDITSIGSYSNLGYVAMQQAILPQYESKSDYWIYSHLAEKMGWGKEFTEGRDEMGWIRKFYNQTIFEAKAAGMDMPKFAEFWKCGMVTFPVPEESENYNYMGDFRKNPIVNPLGTESGKIEIFSEKVASYKYDDCQGHPMWFEPTEWLGAKTAKEYPFALLTSKSRYRLHSQLDSSVSNTFTNVQEREPIWMHPQAAEKVGVENGDVVMVESRRGKVLAGVIVTDRIRPDTVVVHHGAWYCPKEPGKVGSLDVHGCDNVLTIDIPSSKLACGNVANTSLVKVKKYDGDLPLIYVHHQPNLAR